MAKDGVWSIHSSMELENRNQMIDKVVECGNFDGELDRIQKLHEEANGGEVSGCLGGGGAMSCKLGEIV